MSSPTRSPPSVSYPRRLPDDPLYGVSERSIRRLVRGGLPEAAIIVARTLPSEVVNLILRYFQADLPLQDAFRVLRLSSSIYSAFAPWYFRTVCLTASNTYQYPTGNLTSTPTSDISIRHRDRHSIILKSIRLMTIVDLSAAQVLVRLLEQMGVDIMVNLVSLRILPQFFTDINRLRSSVKPEPRHRAIAILTVLRQLRPLHLCVTVNEGEPLNERGDSRTVQQGVAVVKKMTEQYALETITWHNLWYRMDFPDRPSKQYGYFTPNVRAWSQTIPFDFTVPRVDATEGDGYDMEFYNIYGPMEAYDESGDMQRTSVYGITDSVECQTKGGKEKYRFWKQDNGEACRVCGCR